MPDSYVYPPRVGRVLQYYSLADLTTPEEDPFSQFVAARHMANNWIEVDYDDDVVTDTSDPTDGIRWEMGLIRDLLGVQMTLPYPGEVIVSIEVDALLPTNCYVGVTVSDSTGYAAGVHRGVGIDSNGVGHRANALATTVFGSSTYDATGRIVRWQNLPVNTNEAQQRASISELLDADGEYLVGFSELGVTSYNGAGGLQLTVGHSGAGAGGTQTARFRVSTYAFSRKLSVGISS